MNLLRSLWNRYRRVVKVSQDVPDELWNLRGSAASGVRAPRSDAFGDPTGVNDTVIPDSHVARVAPTRRRQA